jgi:hypothetical protein
VRDSVNPPDSLFCGAACSLRGDVGVTFWAKNRFRVFYDVNVAEQQVLVLAIGVKEGNRLLIGGKEFQT